MNPSTSPAQIDANRANARRSTGPITEEGKAHSSQNARVHGLCSRQLHIAGEEEAAIFASLRGALSTELVPVGALELIHFETILHSQWNLRRCRMNEAKLLASVPDPFLDSETRAALKTLAIYTSRHERARQNALKELKPLQNERAARTNFASGPADDGENAAPSPLVETVRVRRTLLAEIRTKAALNKINLDAAIQQPPSNSLTRAHPPRPSPISNSIWRRASTKSVSAAGVPLLALIFLKLRWESVSVLASGAVILIVSCLIAGASRGIGLAIAKEMAAAGAHTILAPGLSTI